MYAATTAWCGTCRTRREVMDEYRTEDRHGHEYLAQPLACGHDANDGGHRAPRPRVRRDASLVQRLVALQDGAL
jgi:hypothetical protein